MIAASSINKAYYRNASPPKAWYRLCTRLALPVDRPVIVLAENDSTHREFLDWVDTETNKPHRLRHPSYSFDEKEAQAAYDTWGCNCGPSALATIVGLNLDRIRLMIPTSFEERHYTNPTMMQAALRTLGVAYHDRDDSDCDGHTLTRYGLVRIQFEGPWTKPGSNPKWSYRQTHWVAAAMFPIVSPVLMVFDINGGWLTQPEWENTVMPELVKITPRANGQWHATHRWELDL